MTKPADLSAVQKQTLLILSETKGLTTKEVGEEIKMKHPVTLLDSLRGRGLVRATGHSSPSRCRWMLTETGVELQKKIIRALPN